MQIQVKLPPHTHLFPCKHQKSHEIMQIKVKLPPYTHLFPCKHQKSHEIMQMKVKLPLYTLIPMKSCLQLKTSPIMQFFSMLTVRILIIFYQIQVELFGCFMIVKQKMVPFFTYYIMYLLLVYQAPSYLQHFFQGFLYR